MAAITYSATEDAFMFGEFDTGIPSSAAVRWSTESKPAPVVWMKRMDGIRSRQKASTYGWDGGSRSACALSAAAIRTWLPLGGKKCRERVSGRVIPDSVNRERGSRLRTFMAFSFSPLERQRLSRFATTRFLFRFRGKRRNASPKASGDGTPAMRGSLFHLPHHGGQPRAQRL